MVVLLVGVILWSFFADWPVVLLGRDQSLFRSIAHNSHGPWSDKEGDIKKLSKFLNCTFS
jgi:hypothetical protein